MKYDPTNSVIALKDRQRDDRKLHGPLEGQINQWRAVDQWRAVWTDRWYGIVWYSRV